jgi:CHAT domain-containing protein
LDKYRVVYIATHALVADEVERLAKAKAEPSLVLSIPPKPTEGDDGLLRASDVALLKMNADFVVLSACNTAAGRKPVRRRCQAWHADFSMQVHDHCSCRIGG